MIAVSPTGSRHGYYRHAGAAEWPKNSSHTLAANVDVKSQGGYVLVPPSVHPVKREPYRWESLGEPGTLPPDVLAKLRGEIQQAALGDYTKEAIARASILGNS